VSKIWSVIKELKGLYKRVPLCSVKFVAGDWDNESDENVIESVTLTNDFFEMVG